MAKEFVPQEGDLLYTVKEAAKLLKCSPVYIYKLINVGILPALKLGSLKIRRSALIKVLEEYEGMDLHDLSDIQPLEIGGIPEEDSA